MPIHDFQSDFRVLPGQSISPPAVENPSEVLNKGRFRDTLLPYGSLSDFEVYDKREFIHPGLTPVDEALRNYWSDVRVPTKDSYRFMRVRVAGGHRSLDVWLDDLRNGSVQLPVAALDRTGHKFNEIKYSPPVLPMAIRFTSAAGNKAIKTFRPMPLLVDYTLIVWSAHKTDAEAILWQITTRFNGGLAELKVNDGRLQGGMQLQYGGHTDASNKEVGADEQQNVRYEFTFTAEAWLPLPEIVVPTVLGQIQVVKEESTGEVFSSFRSQLKSP